MEKMGFSMGWIAWIRATLVSAQASVIVNGAPTDEFDVRSGLRQPISVFVCVSYGRVSYYSRRGG